MAKYLLIIDVNDELLEDYENFYIDYDLRAERKNEMVNESIKYVEDCPLKPLPSNLDWSTINRCICDTDSFELDVALAGKNLLMNY